MQGCPPTYLRGQALGTWARYINTLRQRAEPAEPSAANEARDLVDPGGKGRLRGLRGLRVAVFRKQGRAGQGRTHLKPAYSHLSGDSTPWTRVLTVPSPSTLADAGVSKTPETLLPPLLICERNLSEGTVADTQLPFGRLVAADHARQCHCTCNCIL